MGLEAATHITDLVNSNPVGATDTVSTLDNHIRLIKSVLLTDFAGISGAVTATHMELNYLDITTLGTGEASKAITADASANVDASALTWTDLGTVTTVDINGGTIDGTVIGGSSEAAGTFAALTATGAFTSLGIDDNASSTVLLIDSSSNIGLGVTPEAWAGTLTGLQVGGVTSLSGTTAQAASGTLYLANNVYNDGTAKYIVTDEATQYLQLNGTHLFRVAASGAADSAISWTTALTIDNSGNVGFGVTPKSGWQSTYSSIQLGGLSSLSSLTAASAGGIFSISQNSYNNGGTDDYIISSEEAATYRIQNGTHVFRVAGTGTADNPISWTTALTISNGGTVTPGVALSLTDNIRAYFGTGNDYWLRYNSSGTQFEFVSTDVDGGGSDGVVWSVDDGTDDVDFTGDITIGGGITVSGTSADLGTVTTIDINGGTIDGTVIGGVSAAAGTFSTLTAAGFANDANKNVMLGDGSLATTATDGFAYIPTMSGTPTGAATAKAGFSPLVYDDSGNKLWVYTGLTWIGVALS